MATTETVYVVRDASGKYLRADGSRTPTSDEAHEFDSREQAEAACERSTDRVLSRRAGTGRTGCNYFGPRRGRF